MTLRNTASSWGPVSRFLHWLIVLLILYQGLSGLFGDDLSREMRKSVMSVHKSIGITIIALALLRLLWRFHAGHPDPVPGTTRMQALVASAGHWLLYALMFAVPLSGWAMVSAGGRPLGWFGIPMPALVGNDHDLHERMQGLHQTLFWVLVAVATGHALVALWHHFVKRDAVLTRMLGRLPPPTV